MQQREVRVYLLDALAAAEQIVSIRDEVGANRLREDRIVRAAVERHLITIGEALHKATGLDESIEYRLRLAADSSREASRSLPAARVPPSRWHAAHRHATPLPGRRGSGSATQTPS